MTDKKLTDEEIKSALEQCASDDEGCFRCVLQDMHCANCICRLQAESLNLINRQKAEIEKLKSKYGKLCEYAEKKEFELAEINADISWFREAKISRLAPAIKEIKAEAYKEFVDRLKEKKLQSTMDRRICTFEMIDNLLKEMVGEEE